MWFLPDQILTLFHSHASASLTELEWIYLMSKVQRNRNHWSYLRILKDGQLSPWPALGPPCAWTLIVDIRIMISSFTRKREIEVGLSPYNIVWLKDCRTKDTIWKGSECTQSCKRCCNLINSYGASMIVVARPSKGGGENAFKWWCGILRVTVPMLGRVDGREGISIRPVKIACRELA